MRLSLNSWLHEKSNTSESPLSDDPRTLSIINILLTGAAAELVRIRLEQDLRENEAQLQDLFEEAPVAYVHENMNTRFIGANRAARTILGISLEEVRRTIGSSLPWHLANKNTEPGTSALRQTLDGTRDKLKNLLRSGLNREFS